jgi:hypothetical protein
MAAIKLSIQKYKNAQDMRCFPGAQYGFQSSLSGLSQIKEINDLDPPFINESLFT